MHIFFRLGLNNFTYPKAPLKVGALQQGQCSSMDAGISPASPKPGAEHGDDGVDSPARSHRRSCRCPGWRSPLPAVSIALARMLPLCDSREGINIVGKSAARIHHCPPAGWQGRH